MSRHTISQLVSCHLSITSIILSWTLSTGVFIQKIKTGSINPRGPGATIAPRFHSGVNTSVPCFYVGGKRCRLKILLLIPVVMFAGYFWVSCLQTWTLCLLLRLRMSIETLSALITTLNYHSLFRFNIFMAKFLWAHRKQVQRLDEVFCFIRKNMSWDPVPKINQFSFDSRLHINYWKMIRKLIWNLKKNW